jgi:hypothetical protein
MPSFSSVVVGAISTLSFFTFSNALPMDLSARALPTPVSVATAKTYLSQRQYSPSILIILPTRPSDCDPFSALYVLLSSGFKELTFI